ncbi:MAG: acetyl-CoA acetyltransferase [Hyphomicrobiales bacterium]|nr:acetyl-CoA acetyltransferase [Hyphomicrobiales bacterium]
MTKIEERTPILVGCGDVTDATTPVEQARSPFDLIAEAGRRALADCSAAALAPRIDTIAMLRLFADTSFRFATKLGTSSNPPRSIARRLGLKPSREIYTWNGGNMPQYLVNWFAEEISQGRMRAAMICGGEALRTQHGAERAGIAGVWNEDPGGEPELVGEERRGWSDHEDAHGMRAAIAMYPLIENAVRAEKKNDIPTHMREMAELFARFAAVAAENPLATRREGYSAERIATASESNRWIGFPYPRLMNANAFIDQAGALVVTSVGEARRAGVPESKWVFLHGCADGHDHWYLSERENIARSPCMQSGAKKALAMAGKRIDEIDSFDLYSCFPSAVEIACRELGLAENDTRGLTITGGLPYFGGPGNSYVLFSIAEMVRRMRARPGKFGLVTANGNYITKHSWGVYSTTPTQGTWTREAPNVLQAELDALPKAPFTQTPSGDATIETYTIMHGKNGPELGIVIGRERASGRRFIANTANDVATLTDLQEKEGLGRPGVVKSEGGKNVFSAA